MKKFDLKKVDTRKFFGTIIGGVFFLFCILYFTYAYYVWESEQSDVVLEIQDLSIECILGTDVNANDIGPVLNYQDGVKAEFSISSGNTDVVTLSLDIASISENLLVDSFKYVLVYDIEGGTDYDYDNPILEGDFSEFQIGANEITNALTIQGGSTYSYQFIVYIDGNVYNDPNMQQNSLVAELVLGNCGQVSNNFSPVLATEHVQNLYNDGSVLNTVNIGGSTDNPTVSLNANQGIMLDNNGDYRYYGSNPNNYVEFNNELWRIISVGNVKSSIDDTVGETRVKIVKADELIDDNGLSGYSWDSSIVNDWSQADLMNELNMLYYNQKSGTCYNGINNASIGCDFTNSGLNSVSRNMIGNALYYLGGNSNIYGSYADDYYSAERGTAVWPSTGNTCDDGACPRATRWSGKVGLIYASDYAYATDLNLCTSVGSFYSDSNCVNNNWLAKTNYYWTISPFTNYKSRVLLASNSISDFAGAALVGNGYNVFPVVYLNANVVIISGDGTSGTPFILK